MFSGVEFFCYFSFLIEFPVEVGLYRRGKRGRDWGVHILYILCETVSQECIFDTILLVPHFFPCLSGGPAGAGPTHIRRTLSERIA
jgi:hypothetical protein